MAPGLDPYRADPAQYVVSAGYALYDLDHDLFDMRNVSPLERANPLELTTPGLHTGLSHVLTKHDFISSMTPT